MKITQASQQQREGNFSADRQQSPRRRPPVFALLVMALALLLALPVACLAAGSANTVFLPLKIVSATDRDSLVELADNGLNKALAASSSKMIPRDIAAGKIDYTASWPPSLAALASVAAESADLKYVAAGSLTLIGKQLSVDIKVYDLLDPSSPAFFYLESKDASSLDLQEIVYEILAYTGREFSIADISPRGNKRIDSGAILQQIMSRPGDRYHPDNLREDLKNIFKMGYFDDVKIEVKDTDKGKDIIFEVKEKPVIGQIKVTGEKKLKEDAILEAVSIKTNTILNQNNLIGSASSIIALYKAKGYFNVEVETKTTFPNPENVDIEFVINEGPKIYTREINFVGNNSFKEGRLRKVLETKEKGLFSWMTDSGLLKREVLEQDVARLTAFYHNHGYIDAKIGEPEVTQKDKSLFITFNISEGDRYRVGNVDISGDLIAERQTLLDLVKIKNEEYLSRNILQDDLLRLSDFYSEKGYAFADTYPAVNKRGDEKKVDIDIKIEKGELVHINRIIIKGNTRTRDKVIRRELLVKEKGLFDSKALRNSHQRLQRLDYFEEININPEPTLDESSMDVIVKVKEKPTGAFSLGAGYSSVDNLMFMGEISQKNFLGKGQTLAFQANLSSRSTRYNISFTEPHLNDSRLLFGFDLYNWQYEYDDYTKDSTGGAVRFGYPVWKEWQMAFAYGYDHTELKDVKSTASIKIKDSQDIKDTSYVRLGFNRDTLDRPFDPSSGSLNAINLKFAGGPLGGDSAFTKLEGSSSWFFPLFWDTTYHVKGSAGQVFENSSGKLPVYEKFYLGGMSTIRGFNPSQISPKDPATDERIGGDKMWYMNHEWIFPLVKDAGLKGIVFFDMGNAYNDWDFGVVKKSVGTGFRWISPMGPLRLEWGYNLDPATDEDQSKWDFSIGAAF